MDNKYRTSLISILFLILVSQGTAILDLDSNLLTKNKNLTSKEEYLWKRETKWKQRKWKFKS